jgi:outer membrane receptor protein involved in Fe transport
VLDRLPRVALLVLSLCAAWPGAAAAQDVEVPIFVVDDGGGATDRADDDELDLANLVTSAAKTVTTVQEAPTIVTIVTRDDLDMLHVATLGEVADYVPGFIRASAFHLQFPFFAPRGQILSALFLRDGFSLFDPFGNTTSIHNGMPVEMVKRIETISGPGGVLWGANSFLGVVNVISKDAGDVDGVEAGLGVGEGPGDPHDYRGYVMAGMTDLFGWTGVDLLVHTSFQSYLGPTLRRPGVLYVGPPPSPNSYNVYGPAQDTAPARSSVFNFDGNLRAGNLRLHWSLPVMDRHMPVSFVGALSEDELPEDRLPACEAVDPNDPLAGDPKDGCVDRGRVSRNHVANFYERYGLLEHRARLGASALLTSKASLVQFIRHFDPILILMPIPTVLEGGLAYRAAMEAYRAGVGFDLDYEITDELRLLTGVEALHDWMNDDTASSRQGPGIEATFIGPYDVSRLPFACPLEASWDAMNRAPTGARRAEDCPLTIVFEVQRTTIGGYTSLQYRPTRRLILDGGVRLQAAPELTARSRGYGLAPTFSAAAVYQFAPDMYVKLNYAEGFRPPVFNNTDSNGQAVQIDGATDLEVERSRSGQIEVNARLLRGYENVRELSLRADYSYSVLENFIGIVGGRYKNVGDRGLQSAELLARLYLTGGHNLMFGYTFAYTSSDDSGAYLSYPNNWFFLAAGTTLVDKRLEGSFGLRVIGAVEDPNRRAETRDLMRDPTTGSADINDPTQTAVVRAEEMVVDRGAPAAQLMVGLRAWPFGDDLRLDLTLENALDGNRPAYDQSNDLEARAETLPMSFERLRVYLSATMRM